MNFRKLKELGPGLLVTAAFIGPGTITTCTLSGANFGYALLWSILFSIIATIVLQEMTVRLGIIGKLSLGEALQQQFHNPVLKTLTTILVISAILIGNAAYESGNIVGASMGIKEISGFSKITIANFSINIWGPIIGIVAFIILQKGSYKSIEKVIIALVMLMSLAFVTTAIFIGPNLLDLLKGLFVPKVPGNSIFMIIGLIGTTIVPYNLFLHSSTVMEKWKNPDKLPLARTDLVISVLLGGLISISVVITSAFAFYGTSSSISGASDLANQLTPLLGKWSGTFMAIGLFAAGVSSAITAPLAAAYATTGILNIKSDYSSFWFRTIWKVILIIGIIFSALGFNPIQLIVFAQLTNGLLLPFIAIFLLVVMNNSTMLKEYKNNKVHNIIGGIIILITLLLGAKSVVHALF